MNLKITAGSLVIALATFSAAQAQEKKLKREQLPPAVEKIVAEQSKGATIVGFSTEVEHGKRLYEVELKVDGRGIVKTGTKRSEIQVAPDGQKLAHPE